jgi:uncharacterized protein YecE (DUF72 family)
VDQQLSLFETAHGSPASSPDVHGAAVNDQTRLLAQRLGPLLHLGTSSWSFPGWRGVVYRDAHDDTQLARDGLGAYAEHPLLRTVSVDRTYYGPLERSAFEDYARRVPEDFRFMVKAPAECTTPWLRGAGGQSGGDNPRFLNVDFAYEMFVRSAYDGLGERCGPLVFQFPPQGRAALRNPRQFADRLYGFLSRLPRLPLYAVELRDAPLMTDAYVDALRAAGAQHCVSVHPRAATLGDQADVLATLGPGPLVARWNLNPAHTYAEAKARYAPFDRLQEEDPASRQALAQMCVRSLRAGQPVYLVANNKAEGSAPLTIFALAGAIDRALA